MTDLVIFDCDGVLVDSEPISVRIDVEMLAELGLTATEEEVIERFVGRSARVIVESVEEELGHPPPDGWFEHGERRLRQAFVNELRPVPGVVEALKQITQPTCVASSSAPEQLRFKLKLTGLYDRFAGRLFSGSEVENGKPAPDLFLYAAARMGTQPTACLVVEDSHHGVEAARAAGMDVLAYAGGGMIPRQALKGPRTVVFDDMRELPRLIEARR